MPSRGTHWDAAKRAERFAHSLWLFRLPFLEWAVTGLFYAGLHYVEAYLAAPPRNIHPLRHSERQKLLLQYAPLTMIYDDYEELKNYSVNARYYAYRFSRAEVRELLCGPFAGLKAHLERVLAGMG